MDGAKQQMRSPLGLALHTSTLQQKYSNNTVKVLSRHSPGYTSEVTGIKWAKADRTGGYFMLQRTSRQLFLRAVLFLFSLGSVATAQAEVFFAQDEAMLMAFGQEAVVDRKAFVLDDAQAQKIEAQAHAKLNSKLVSVYSGRSSKGELLGYAVIDTHMVRTHNQTFMVVLTPQGQVKKTVVLAFHEPLEYRASERWTQQFEGKSQPSEVRLGSEISGIVGSTLTSEAIAAGVRRVLAIYNVLSLSRE